ncbi:fatty acid--CoA ligase [Guptibacillus hwajinpoensis]|uniref:Long-chain fatty acid--CoA ligase n=1 Tax=Guptibacillus hwajinpoensis TaxID=208199 RepID=A0A0J6CRU7_9BACL|nr:fatty acid--CoA ligase [Alkalihalobacillus macyae]KMM39026.1 long-chain fatty acid--CoA ligase [Alkalihalobacillus macyae]
MYVTIGSLFLQTVKKYGKEEALIDPERDVRWTYEQWNAEVNRLANALLDAGVKKGDRVSTLLFNTVELGTLFFSCAKIGAVLNPINFRLKPNEVAYIIEDAEPSILVYEKMLEPVVSAIQNNYPDVSFWSIDDSTPAYAESYTQHLRLSSDAEPEADVDENDLYAIMYTSGTTGRPKGVMHRHRSMVEQSLMCAASLHLKQADRGLVVAPMFHCAELHCSFLPRVHFGATNVILHHFDPKKVLETVENEKISLFFAAPTMWNMILQEDYSRYDRSSLRVGLYGAAPMAPSLVTAVKDLLGINLIQAYGMTEMGPAVTFLDEHEQLAKVGSAGRAAINHEVRVVRPNEHGPSEPEDVLPSGEVGEIIVRGPSMMIGYYNRPDASETAMYKGWYHSGDLGYMDKDNYLYVSDRVDDMVISGGENVYPREVEDAIHAHAAVLDVAVLGQPDEKWGEVVTAVVVKKSEVTAEELDRYCKESPNLADYKRPRKYIFVDELPRNASGKIQKFRLREQFQVEPNV